MHIKKQDRTVWTWMFVIIAIIVVGALLTGCGATVRCPRPVQLPDGSYTVAKMSKTCEKKLVKYAKHTTTKKTVKR